MVDGTPLRMTAFFQLLLCSMSAFTSKRVFNIMHSTRKSVSKQVVTSVRHYVHTHEQSVNDISLNKGKHRCYEVTYSTGQILANTRPHQQYGEFTKKGGTIALY